MKDKTTEELIQLADKVKGEFSNVQTKMQTLYKYMSKLAVKYNDIKKELESRGVSIDNNQQSQA